MIRTLPDEVRGSLRAGVAISSVGQCVEELLLNSIDAQATCVAVRVDLETLKIQVVDNGCGLCRDDIEKVGTRYLTSKCYTLKDLENLKYYGFRGEAIASMAEMSSVVEISSRYKNTVRTLTKLFQNGKPMQVQEAEINRPSTGTTVTVFNLFYNLPVRRKCMDHKLEFERIRQRVEAASLVHPSISFSLKNDAACSVILQLPKTKDVCSRFCQIYGLSQSQKLLEILHRFKSFNMSGYISCEGHYNKTMQYLYVNNRLVLKTKLHKLIDFILRKESSICRPKNAAGKLNVSPGRNRSGPEIHGIFIIHIQCDFSEYDVCFEPAKTLIEFQDWSTVLQCVEEGVKIFLRRANLYLEPSKEDISDFNERSKFSLSSSKFQHVEEDDQQEVFQKACDNIMDSYDLANLKSKFVSRCNTVKRHTVQDSGNENSVNKIKKMPEVGNNVIDDDIRQACSTTSAMFTCVEKVINLDYYNNNNSVLIPEVTKNKDMEREICSHKHLMDESSKSFSPQVSICSTILPSDMYNEEKTEGCMYSTPINEPSLLLLNKTFVRDSVSAATYNSLETCSVNDGVIDAESAPVRLRSSGCVINATPKSPIEILKDKMSSVDHNNMSINLGHISSNVNAMTPNNPAINSGPNDTLSQHCNFSSVPHTGPRCTNNPAKIPASRTLRLFGQHDSLQRFKRNYENMQSLISPPHSLLTGDSFRTLSKDGYVSNCFTNDTADLYFSKIKEKTITPSANSFQSEYLTEKNVITQAKFQGGETSPIIQESPLTLLEYSHLKLHPSSENKSCISLTSKLRKLRHNKKSSHLEDASDREIPQTSVLLNELSKDTTTIETSPDSVVGRNGDVFTNPDLHTFEEQLVCSQNTETNVCEIHPLNLPEKDSRSTTAELSGTYSSFSEDVPIGIASPKASNSLLSDWVQCYEESLGRNVFINKATGHSSYSAPLEERSTICTNDITTMAVNIVSNNGFQYQCHPFRGELLVPFLPRPREERELISKNRDNNTCIGSLQSLYSQWENPVFARHPLMAVDVSTGQADTLAVKIHNILHPYRFTKEMIHSMKVVQQVDNKFIACLMDTCNEEKANPGGNLLVLVDQHAAHERVRLEQLIADSYEPELSSCDRRILKMSVVSPPLELDVAEQQCRLLRAYSKSLNDLGLSLSFPDSCTPRVLVGKVPLCFVEKEASETLRGRSTVAKTMVKEYLREQVELLQVAGGAHRTFPRTVLKVLASQACHGAVKFNDGLSLEECTHLVQALAACQLPFQCAHGRPSVLPLVDICHLEMGQQVLPPPNLSGLKNRQRCAEAS